MATDGGADGDEEAAAALRAAAETAWEQCLALGADESCVIVTDDERRPIGDTLYEVAGTITDDATIVQYPPGEQHGEEPPATVAAALRSADVFLAPTTMSLSHTRARDAATEAGVRGATMPEITREVMIQGLDADYEAIAAECDRVLELVRDAETVRVTSPQGTDLTLEPGAREWLTDTGLVHDAGDFSNLPAGEVFVSPETATGTYVVDGTIPPIGSLAGRDPIEITVEDGTVTGISDETLRAEIEAAAEEAGEAAYNLAELGIGTNVGVTSLVGHLLLDEKAAGTVHIAIGDNASLGGDTEAPIHLDGVLREPTVFVDGAEIALPEAR
jgi:leucyl aminopeptidase (aminopeptidase T)